MLEVIVNVLVLIIGFFVIIFLIFVPAMIANKCGNVIKIIVTAFYILVGLGLVSTIIATPLAVLLVKQACTAIWDEK